MLWSCSSRSLTCVMMAYFQLSKTSVRLAHPLVFTLSAAGEQARKTNFIIFCFWNYYISNNCTVLHDFIHTGIMNYCNLVEKSKRSKKKREGEWWGSQCRAATNNSFHRLWMSFSINWLVCKTCHGCRF